VQGKLKWVEIAGHRYTDLPVRLSLDETGAMADPRNHEAENTISTFLGDFTHFSIDFQLRHGKFKPIHRLVNLYQ
jgi:hypothetical protein